MICYTNFFPLALRSLTSISNSSLWSMFGLQRTSPVFVCQSERGLMCLQKQLLLWLYNTFHAKS